METGMRRHKEFWWWKEEIAASIKEKQRLFKLLKGPRKCRKGADVGRQADAKCVDAGGKQEAWTKCSLDMESRNIIEEEELLRKLSSRQGMLRG